MMGYDYDDYDGDIDPGDYNHPKWAERCDMSLFPGIGVRCCNCGTENVLTPTPEERAHGYECDSCADAESTRRLVFLVDLNAV